MTNVAAPDRSAVAVGHCQVASLFGAHNTDDNSRFRLGGRVVRGVPGSSELLSLRPGLDAKQVSFYRAVHLTRDSLSRWVRGRVVKT